MQSIILLSMLLISPQILTVVDAKPISSSNQQSISANNFVLNTPNVKNNLLFLSQQAYVKASNTDDVDYFANSVAIYGDTLVVGAYHEDSNAVGVGGDDSNNSVASSGAVYVYTRSNDDWVFDAYIKASNAQSNDWFGYSVAIYEDTIVVGARLEDSDAIGVNGDQNNDMASSSGAAYVFKKINNVWAQQAYLKAANTQTNDNFGDSVAIHGDYIAISALREDSNAIGVDGDLSNNDASKSGAVYLYQLIAENWEYISYIKASNTDINDEFGESIALSDGLLVVGSENEDSNSQGIGGAQSNNSASNSGAVYVYKLTSGALGNNTWEFDEYIKASNAENDDHFGSSVAISNNTSVVGADTEESNATGVNGDQSDNSLNAPGAAYVFSRSNDNVWSQKAYLKASNTKNIGLFGNAVSIWNNRIVVASRGESNSATGVNGDQDSGLAIRSGAAYLFINEDDNWSQAAYIKPFNTDADDNFGRSASISSHDIVLGTRSEDSNSTGVNGADNNLSDRSGAAYVFNYVLDEIYQDSFE